MCQKALEEIFQREYELQKEIDMNQLTLEDYSSILVCHKLALYLRKQELKEEIYGKFKAVTAAYLEADYLDIYQKTMSLKLLKTTNLVDISLVKLMAEKYAALVEKDQMNMADLVSLYRFFKRYHNHL
jgi:hypothetical protein